jgi:serine/threonine protein phosphatase PrpC
MGGFLEKPITTKNIKSGQSEKLRYTSCEMQGWRKYMEDTKLAHLALEGFEHLSLFGVFDGHGGDEVAKYV